jgi:hypothetical protein
MRDCDVPSVGPYIFERKFLTFECSCGKITQVPFLFCNNRPTISSKTLKCLGCYNWKIMVSENLKNFVD